MSGMWGGRFEKGTDPEIKRFNDSLVVDHRLLAAELEASTAWAQELAEIKLLTSAERDAIVKGLQAIGERAAKDLSWVVSSPAEDVHSFVETALVEIVGEPAKKLHTGRSRNDQVTTDLRLWLRRTIGEMDKAFAQTQRALLDLAEKNAKIALPGYTHLQRAQPVLFAHWCLAYLQQIERDRGRFADAGARADQCPLGSGALAGTAFPIDRARLAKRLGFGVPTANSLDAVSDRDYVLETLSACAISMAHLSRMAEDLIFYATSESGFVTLGDEVSTGSSLMPQKKNPDPLELIRGKCGRVYGHLMGLLTVVKGTPLAYNKDFQEDKEALFDSVETLHACLRVAATVLRNVTLNEPRCREAALAGFSTATDLADYLVKKGVAFRTAHDLVGRVVRRCLETKQDLATLPWSEYQALSKEFGQDLYAAITVEASLAARQVEGGTAPQRVEEAIEKARRRLEAHR